MGGDDDVCGVEAVDPVVAVEEDRSDNAHVVVEALEGEVFGHSDLVDRDHVDNSHNNPCNPVVEVTLGVHMGDAARNEHSDQVQGSNVAGFWEVHRSGATAVARHSDLAQDLQVGRG